MSARDIALRLGASALALTLCNVPPLAQTAYKYRDAKRVGRGEYLANSGSTGFSTGPHLHFAVIRNADFTAVSVPIEFAGPAGIPIVPVTHESLTAY